MRPPPPGPGLLFAGRGRISEEVAVASRDILQSRWLTEDKQTLHKLAAKYGVSAERIRQIEANAIKKLRGEMAA